MKNTLKSAGSIGLATATIVTGLSFGTTTATAATAPTPEDLSTEVVRTFSSPIGWKLADGTFAGVANRSSVSYAQAFATEQAFLAGVYDVKVTQYADETFTLEEQVVHNHHRAYCLEFFGAAIPTDGVVAGRWQACGGTSVDERWIANADGSISPVASPELAIATLETDRFPIMHAGTSGARLVGNDAAGTLFFSAEIDSVDLRSRTAQLSGRAVLGTSVVIDGAGPISIDDDGRWTATVTGLTIGSNTISVAQWEDDLQTGETNLEATLDVSPVVATTTFRVDRNQSAFASGTAHPGAVIVIRDAAGTQIARTGASTTNGAWSVDIQAPGIGGDYPVAIHQEVDGEVNGEISENVAYGAAVSITTPAPELGHDGGPVAMSGTGEAGSRVNVREQGGAAVIGSTTVLGNGSWTLATTSLDDREHVLVATQTGKGANETISTVTLNPESIENPVTVTNPATPADGYTPNAPFTFRGTGTAGKTITVENKFGTVITTAAVGVDGNWSWTRANMGTSTWQLRFIQDKGQPGQSVAEVMDFTPNAAPAPLVIVTNPADPSDGYTPNRAFTFTGTATAGKRITVENKFGTVITTVPVNADTSWSWTRANMGTTIWQLHFVQDKGLAAEYTAKVLGFKPNAAVPAPLVVVTNPASPTDGFTANTSFTFRGTATAGKTITVENIFGTRIATVPVNADASWSWTRANMGTSTWQLYFTQDQGLPGESRAEVLNFAPNP